MLVCLMCVGPNAGTAGSEGPKDASPVHGGTALKTAGYEDEPVVVLHAVDSALINPVG